MNEEEKFIKDFMSLREKYEKKFNKEVTTVCCGSLKKIYNLMKKSLDEGKDYIPDEPEDVDI